MGIASWWESGEGKTNRAQTIVKITFVALGSIINLGRRKNAFKCSPFKIIIAASSVKSMSFKN